MGPIRQWTHQNWTAILIQAIAGIFVVVLVAIWSGGWRSFEGWMWPSRPPILASPSQPAPVPRFGIRVVVADDVKLPENEEQISAFLREHIRGKNHVRSLLPEESNTKIRNAPRGVWGWAMPETIKQILAIKR
jgi:hypothetical protein